MIGKKSFESSNFLAKSNIKHPLIETPNGGPGIQLSTCTFFEDDYNLKMNL